MAIAHSTAQSKPSKPYADFPLTAHRNGQWCKKIRGKLHYFGPWADHEGALDRYDKVKDDLHAGKTPRPIQDELTLSDLVNHFLTAKRNRVDSGELSMRTWKDYYASTKRILNQFGKNRLLSDLRSDDFAKFRNLLDKTLGPVALGNEIQRARTLFKYAFEEDFVATQIKFGSSFKKPTMKTLRKHRAESRLEHGKRMFEPQDVHRLIRDASLPMRAMILLGINCGFGNNDCAPSPYPPLTLQRAGLTSRGQKRGLVAAANSGPKLSRPFATGYRPGQNRGTPIMTGLSSSQSREEHFNKPLPQSNRRSTPRSPNSSPSS